MQIAGTATAFPDQYYSQADLSAALQQRWAPTFDNPGVIERMLTRVGVDGRYLALPMEKYYKLNAFGVTNDAWIEVACDLGEKALCRALTRAGVEPDDL